MRPRTSRWRLYDETMPADRSNTAVASNYHPLVRQVARGLRQRCKVPAGAHVLVAVSGGADSVALLRALALLAPRRKFRLTLSVAHINHHLRGEQSDADALFVQTLANHLSIPCHITGIHPADAAGNLEANARKERYAALEQLARQSGAPYIATAHHADDQLETLLMRFLRGSSVRGLRGIAPRRRVRNDHSSLKLSVVRPMIAAGREEVLGFLQSLGQRWREDASNGDTAFLRNRLRHEVVPLLKQIRTDAATRAVNLADHFTDLHNLVESSTDDYQMTLENHRPPEPAPPVEIDAEEEVEMGPELVLDSAPPPGHASPVSPTVFPRDEARQLNPVVLNQTLRRALLQAGVQPDTLPGHALRPVVQAVRDHEGGTRTFQFANHTTITVTREEVAVQISEVKDEVHETQD